MLLIINDSSTLIVDYTILSFILSAKMNLKFYIRSNMCKIKIYKRCVPDKLASRSSKPFASSNNILAYILYNIDTN